MQFNKETQKAHIKMKVKLEKAGTLTHKEIYKNSHKTININKNTKSKKVETLAFHEESDFDDDKQ